ncbi:hypothetical protein EMIT0111MI5_50433 [Burkholderia sp. IT-111MI5]
MGESVAPAGLAVGAGLVGFVDEGVVPDAALAGSAADVGVLATVCVAGAALSPPHAVTPRQSAASITRSTVRIRFLASPRWPHRKYARRFCK